MGLWVLGETLDSPRFQNASMNEISSAKKAASPEAEFAYKDTSAGSQVRKWASDTLACKAYEVGSDEYQSLGKLTWDGTTRGTAERRHTLGFCKEAE